jgi:hypothetical protein
MDERRPRGEIQVCCMTCRHKGAISEQELARFGLSPGSPIAKFVKRLRCRKCGSGSVMASRGSSKAA